MNSLPFISVVVVVRNGGRYMRACMDSLVDLDYPHDLYEILIVDGASTDDTRSIIEEYIKKSPAQRIVLLSNDKKYIAPGRNIGLSESKGKYVAYTDADCVVDKNWLTALAKGMTEAGKDVVAVGGPNLIFKDDPFFAQAVGYMQETFFGSGGSPQSYHIDKPEYVYSIPNCNVLYNKELMGGERYDDAFNVGEDCEYNYRLNSLGKKFLYLPSAIVWHHRRDNLKDFFRSMMAYGEAAYRVSKKHKKPVRFYTLIPSLAIVAVLLAVPLILLFPFLLWAYLFVFALYSLGALAAASYVYGKTKDIRSLMVLFLLPVQHTAYGLGFFRGIIKK
ncbi:MAG: glycosyltransferase [Candidatus Altiarchaeia archaeon]